VPRGGGHTGDWSYEDLLPVFMAQEDNDTFHDEYHGMMVAWRSSNPRASTR
jgi:hypothetical protein